MINRNDLLDTRSPKGIEVFQLTTRTDMPSSHVYMEAQIFTPDSKRLVLHESAHAHGSDKDDPNHRYMLCDLENGGRLSPLTDELGPTAPSLDPEGKWLYYLADRTGTNSGTLALKRVRLDGTDRQTLTVWDKPIPGEKNRISRIYPLSTISSDGKRFAFAGFLGDGTKPNDDWGLVVVDLETLSSRVVFRGAERLNLHPQYCRSKKPEHQRLIMVQDNHGSASDETGKLVTLVSGLGADIHVLNDDGTGLRDLPWGRVENEQCQGHQCWRGESDVLIGTVTRFDHHMPLKPGQTKPYTQEWVIESPAAGAAGHLGLNAAGGKRNILNANFPSPPQFLHFATDRAGRRLIIDCEPDPDRGALIYLADLNDPMAGPPRKWTYLLDTRSDFWKARGHPHPFLSPDGKTAFFNSNESGRLQAYMIRGLENIAGA